jgi:nicotinamide riboside kinase
MRNTKVINLIGAPGTGKSTIASELFARMKWLGYSVELVSEYAKELVWEQRHETMKNEVYLFGKQHHRFFRLQGKVDFIITDRPLILSLHYNNVYGDKSIEYANFVRHEVNKLDNINIFLERTKPYVTEGRNQSEEESIEFGIQIKQTLDDNSIKYIIEKALPDTVSDNILKMISKK